MSKSKLEAKFLSLWQTLASDLPQPEQEYKFARDIVGHGPGIRKRLRAAGLRDWRLDFAWAGQKVAVEIEGGTWVHGSHTRGGRYALDCFKYNQAALDGWVVLRFTTDMLDRDPGGCVEQVVAALGGEEALPFTDVTDLLKEG